MQTFAQYFFGISLFLTSIFLILLVLVQRGRGGGLAGALGGAGGQSAFGTKAGDVFTKITVGAAFVWIVLCLTSIGCLNDVDSKLDDSLGTGGAAGESRETPNEIGGGGSGDDLLNELTPGTPADDTPADDTPADDTPADDTPTNDTPADDTPADETPADETPATPAN